MKRILSESFANIYTKYIIFFMTENCVPFSSTVKNPFSEVKRSSSSRLKQQHSLSYDDFVNIHKVDIHPSTSLYMM